MRESETYARKKRHLHYMPEASQYVLRISAGPDYTNLKTLKVNEEDQPFYIHSDLFTGYVCVRLLNFNGLTPEYYDSLESQRDSNYD
jgi:hypothetical protein